MENIKVNDNRILGVKTNTSVTSTLSSVVGSFTGFFKSYFPENYFKSEFIATSLFSTLLNNADENPKKMRFPALAIEPELLLAEGGLYPYPSYFYTYNWHHKNPRNEYKNLLRDETNDIYLSTIHDRLKLRFNIRILTKGKLQAMDLAMFLARNFEPGGKFFINDVRLKSELPKTYLRIIRDILNLDGTNREDAEFFVRYLKENSMDTLNRVIDLSDGNEKFEYRYSANLLTSVDGKPENSFNRKSKEEGVSTTELAMDVEFWAPGDFFLEVLNRKNTIPIDEINTDEYSLGSDGLYFDIAVENLKIPNEVEDKKIIFKEKIITDSDVDIDHLNLEPFMDSLSLDIIKYAHNNDININEIFHIEMYYGNSRMKSSDYIFNWDSLDLLMQKPFNNSVYHICIYANLAIISDIYEALIRHRNKASRKLEGNQSPNKIF